MPIVPLHSIHISTPILDLEVIEPHVNNEGNDVNYYALKLFFEKEETSFYIQEGGFYPLTRIEATHYNYSVDSEQYKIEFRGGAGQILRTLNLYRDETFFEFSYEVGVYEKIQVELTEDEYNTIVSEPNFAALFAPVPAAMPAAPAPVAMPVAPVPAAMPVAPVPVPVVPNAVVDEAPNEPYEPDMPASRRRKTRRRRVSSNKRKAASRRRRSFRV